MEPNTNPTSDDLLQAARRFQNAQRAKNTTDGYACGWRMFSAWCAKSGRDPLPASDETIALHLTDLIVSGKKISTAEHRFAAIRDQHRRNEFPMPPSALIRSVIWGAKRALKQQPAQKSALTVADMQKICSAAPATPFDVRNRAILLFGFSTALRRCEIARMELSDLKISDKGMLVHLRFEKQDQVGKGRDIPVCLAHHPEMCPVRAMERWLDVRGKLDGALFYQFRMGRMSTDGLCARGEAVALAVKREVKRAGFDPRMYSGHSLRAGFVTSGFLAGLSEVQIAQHTGHRDLNVLRRYIRPKDPFVRAASGLIGL